MYMQGENLDGLFSGILKVGGKIVKGGVKVGKKVFKSGKDIGQLQQQAILGQQFSGGQPFAQSFQQLPTDPYNGRQNVAPPQWLVPAAIGGIALIAFLSIKR